MRLPSTRMTWFSGSTRAPNRRTIWPATSTRPAPISSSQCRRLPTPAAASTFCSRTPPGTSARSSRSPASSAKSSESSSSKPMLRSARRRACASGDSSTGLPPSELLRPRPFIVLNVLNVLRQERRQVGQLVQGRHAQPLEKVAGGAVQNRAGLLIGTGILDEPAQHQRPDHAVAVDTAHRRDPGPADRLPVGDHGQGLERRLREPDLLTVPDEPFDQWRAVLPSIEAPAARYLPQIEAAAVGGVLGREGAQGRVDLAPRSFEHLGEQDLGDRLVGHEQDRLEAGAHPGPVHLLDFGFLVDLATGTGFSPTPERLVAGPVVVDRLVVDRDAVDRV